MNISAGQQQWKNKIAKQRIISLALATCTVMFAIISAQPVLAASVSNFFDHSKNNGFSEDRDAKGHDFWDRDAKGHDFWDRDAKGHDFWDRDAKGHDFWDRDAKGHDFGISNSPSAVPLPGALWLFGSGLLGLLGIARRVRGTSRSL